VLVGGGIPGVEIGIAPIIIIMVGFIIVIMLHGFTIMYTQIGDSIMDIITGMGSIPPIKVSNTGIASMLQINKVDKT
jgi:hypothetical protein